MTEQQASGLKRMCTIAGAGATVGAVGMIGAIPTAIGIGFLACWLGGFLTLIAYLDTVS